GLDLDRQRINLDDFLDRLHVRRERAWAVGSCHRDALDAGDNVLSSEVAAIVELHAGAQLELPGRLAQTLPTLGESRLDLLTRILVDQAVENVARHRAVWTHHIELRIHGRRRGRKTDSQITRHCRHWDEC